MKKKYLVAAKNTDGRVCCWAQSESLDVARAAVDARWPTHGGSGSGCYPGEQRGADEVHLVNEDGSLTPHIASTSCMSCGHARAYHRGPGEPITEPHGVIWKPGTGSQPEPWLCAYPVHGDGSPCACQGFADDTKPPIHVEHEKTWDTITLKK